FSRGEGGGGRARRPQPGVHTRTDATGRAYWALVRRRARASGAAKRCGCRDARRSRACRTGGDTRDWGIGVSCGEDGSEKAGSSKKACHGKENRYREGGGLA